MEAIARHYLFNRPQDSTIYLSNRYDHILKLAEDYKVDGVISNVVRFCAPLENDKPWLKKEMDKRGIPVAGATVNFAADPSDLDVAAATDTMESAVREIQDLPGVRKADAEVVVLDYAVPSWRGLTYPTKKYYPTWLLPEEHPALAGGVKTFEGLFGSKPQVGRWVFSTNGVAVMGMHGIPCIGFDPDPALVELARRKLAPFPDARVATGGFADIARIVPPGVDLVLCLGNSLVHVPQEEARRFVADAAAVVSPAGGILVQILNYEPLFRGHVTELPLMRAQDGAIEFRRRRAAAFRPFARPTP